ncbi:MAG: hypothetical protein ACLRIT_12535 [Blautia sp.]
MAELLEDNPIGEILHAPEADVSGKWVAVFDGIGGLPCGEMASYVAAVTLAKAECPWRPGDVGRILRTFKIKKNVEVTDNGKIII